MDKTNDITISELIFRKLRGEISSEEEALLQDSLDKNPEDRVTFEEMSRIWNEARPKEPEFYPNENLAWQKVMQKAQQSGEQTKVVKLSPISGYLKYAAAAILLISVLLGSWRIWFQEPEIITVASGLQVKEVLLPDGSKVWLNKNSSISFPETFTKERREVSFSGEGYFEVERNPEKVFYISGNASEIQVLGTSFNFRSFPGEADDAVSVLTGKVRLTQKATDNEVVLTAGNYASLSGNDIQKQQGSDPNLLAWKSRKLTFSNSSLKKVGEQLQKFFGKKISISERVEDCRFTGVFEDPELGQILEIINVTMNTELTVSDTVVHITGEGCP